MPGTALNVKRWPSVVCMGVLFATIGVESVLAQGMENTSGSQTGGGEIPLRNDDIWSRFRPRLSFYHQAGDSVGLDESYTSLNAFVPFSRPNADWLLFADLRGQFIDDGALGGSVGAGARLYDPGVDLTFGAYLYYDHRDTGVNQFQQLSPGFEVLASNWEARVNAYLPDAFEARKLAPNAFRGVFLYTDRFETALSGFDAEFGANVPLAESIQPRLFGGVYELHDTQGEGAWGWKSRLEATVSEAISLNLAVQNDRRFDTTLSFGVEVRFSGGALLDPDPVEAIANSFTSRPRKFSAERKLAASTRRLSTIAMGHTEETLAIDPATGLPLMFLHVATGGNSTGAFNDPYATIADALADPRYQSGDIDTIFVRRDNRQAVVQTGDLVLRDGTRLLSAAPLQLVDTDTGTQRLPFSGLDENLNALPQILGSVTLGNDTLISGFEVRSGTPGIPNDVTVMADGVTNFQVANNVLFSSGTDGVHIMIHDVTDGVGMIHNNTIIGDETQMAGILVTESNFALDIMNSDLSNHGMYGIRIEDSSLTGLIAGNRLDNNNRSGVSLLITSPSSTSAFTGSITDNTLSQNELRGIELLNTDLTGNISNNEIDGVFLVGNEPPEPSVSRIFDVSKPRPDISDDVPADDTGAQKPTLGIRIEGGVITGDIADNRSSNNRFGGIFIRDANVSGNIMRNDTVDNGADGIAVQNSTLVGNIDRNTSNNNAFGGILVNDSQMTGHIMNNSGSGNEDQGLLFADGVLTGNVSGNTTLDNGLNGLVVNVPSMLGNFDNNEVRRNGTDLSNLDALTGVVLFADDYRGNITDNTIADQVEDRGMLIAPYSFNVVDRAPLVGDIARNLFADNGVDGLFIIDMEITGNIEDNVFRNNSFGDSQLFIRDNGNGVFTGNIRRNRFEDAERTAMIVRFNDFVGNIHDNTFEGANSAFLEFGNLTGNVSRNVSDNSIHVLVDDSLQGSVTNNTIDGSDFVGLEVSAGNMIGNISDNAVTQSSEHGIQLTINTLTGNVTDNTTSNNGGRGLFLRQLSELTGDISGNIANGNLGGEGIRADADIGQFVGNVQNNISNMNATSGLVLNGIETFEGDFTGNTATENQAGSGFLLAMDFAFMTGDITNNTAANNTGSSSDSAGLAIINLFAMDGNISGNSSSGNQQANGILLRFPEITFTDGGGALTGMISGNTTNNNGLTGLDVQARLLSGEISDNVSTGNLTDGISIELREFSSRIRGNDASSNSGTGILAGVDQLSGSIVENTASANGFTGIYVVGEFSGTISDNTVMNNGDVGIIIEASSTAAPPPPAVVNEAEPNNSRATAQNIDNATFSLESNGDIRDSTTIPHTSINAGGGDGSFDYFEFNANSGDRGIFDVDASSNDSTLFLYDSLGSLLAENDDFSDPGGSGLLSLIDHVFTSSGPFVIGVGEFSSSDSGGAISGNTPAGNYILHVSLENHETGSGGTADPVELLLENNTLQGNFDFGGGEHGPQIIVEHNGSGILNLTLSGNESNDTIAGGEFHFDLTNFGSGSMIVLPANVNGANTGTVGSSDGSVTIP